MDSVFINGTEYSEVWLNGVKISDFDGGTSGGDTGGEEEIVYPYSDADCVITYRNTSSSSKSVTFKVIDSSLPYSINGSVGVNKYTFPRDLLIFSPSIVMKGTLRSISWVVLVLESGSSSML